MPTTFYLLRHAQGWHNEPGPNYVGDSYNDPLFRDASLTPVGLEQTLTTRAKLSSIVFDAIYCSPMRRCRQTLLSVYPGSVDVNVHVDDRLIEQPTGKNIADHRFERDFVVGECPKKWDVARVSDVNPFLTKSDSGDQDKMRTITQSIMKKHPSGNVLVVCHGTWIGRWLDLYQGQTRFIENCEYVVVTMSPGELTEFYRGELACVSYPC
jgi:broad specificity phosphatase PhoE